jgi:hypothetical protein
MTLQQLIDWSERTFVAFRHVFFWLIENEIGIVLIDSIISQMHANLLHVVSVRSLIFFSCEPAQSLLIQIKHQWVDATNQDINSEIEFESIDEIGSMQVPLDHAVRAGIDILKFSREENAFSLWETFRLYNKGPRFAFGLRLKVSLQFMIFNR